MTTENPNYFAPRGANATMNAPTNLDKDEAAAELYKRALDSMGVIDTVWRKPDTNVVCATTHGGGVHLGNQADDFDANVHLVCERDAISTTGSLPDGIDEDEHGGVFFNVVVDGIADGATGDGLPTHVNGKHGTRVREGMSDELRALAERAGVNLE